MGTTQISTSRFGLLSRVCTGYGNRGSESKREWVEKGVKERIEIISTVSETHGIHSPASANEENMNDVGTKVGPTSASNTLGNGVDVLLPVKSIRAISEWFANMAHGFFLGKRVAYPVVANYVKNTWGKYGLVKTMLNSSTRIFLFQFSSIHGLDVVLVNGPWCACCKVFGHDLDDCPKSIDTDVVKNIKKPNQATRGVAVSLKVGFKPVKEIKNDVDLDTNNATSNMASKKATSSRSSFSNVESINTSITSIVEKINKSERVNLWRMLIVRVIMIWKETYENDDHDFDPYDDAMYEGQDVPDKIQAICDNLDMKVQGLDFEKAYDSVRWDFINDILRRFGFGEKWCKWIQSCLYSSRGSVLVNGSPTKEFQFHKGLKQGDPLSPFLFILVMESLNVSFQRVVDASLFNGIKLDSSLHISHLFYADDAIFMGQWSQCNIDTIIRVLDVFYRASGLRINMNKSNLMGISVDSNKVKHAAAKIGWLVLKTPFNYLGSRVGDLMSRIQSWHDVTERMHTRCFKIWNLFVRVFNGADVNSKKPSWVRWKSVLAAKDVGGLRVSNLFALNRSLIFKWVWRFFSQKNSLWVRVVKALHDEDGKISKKAQFERLKEMVESVTLSNSNDRWSWSLVGSGDFSASSVRKLIDNAILSKGISKMRWIKEVPIKINVHAWKKICKGYGKVVDVFILNRKSKAGKRFAFVQFVRVEDIDRLVGNLCTIWIGWLHLHANVVRYERLSRTYNSAGYKQTKVHVSAGSYATAVKGFPDVKLMYLGGMWVMLEFDKVDTKMKLLQHTGVNSWFQVLQDAVHEFVSDDRIVWVDIEGIPLNVWSREMFLRIGLNMLIQYWRSLRLSLEYSDEDSDDDSDVKGVFEPIFGDNSSPPNNCSGGMEDQKSEDPFSIYDLLKKHQLGGARESSPSLSHPPGFTPKVSEIQKNNVHVEGDIDSEVVKEFLPTVNAKVMNNSQEEAFVFKKNYVTISDNFIAIYGTWLPGNSKILFVAIYAPHRASLKRVLWDYVSILLGRWNGEAIIMGDFNEVRSKDERRGSVFNPFSARTFDHFISSSGLVDVKLEGYAFTWSHPSASKMNKLDRFLVLEGILLLFPSIMTICLDRHLSDHHLILLREVHTDFGPVPLWFYHSWFSLDGFDDMVEHAWNSFSHSDANGMIHFKKKLQYLKIIIRQWVKDKKLQMSGARSSIKNELGVIDKDLDHGVISDTNLHRRLELKRQLHDINQLEARDSLQKSKVKCAIEGDENSRFFHGIINKKRSQLSIRRVFVDGLWITEPGKVKDAFLKNFEARFQKPASHRQILDEPFILNEVLNWCKRKKKQAMFFKVNFAKVYDSVCWDYLLDVLQAFGFCQNWCKWVRGDSLSPYLFILIMESLHMSFSRAVNEGLFKGIQLHGSISHIFYADDVIFIGEWSDANLKSIVNILKCFFLASGLKINIHKSQVLGVGIPRSLVVQAAASIGCVVMQSQFRYLGVMVGGCMSRYKAWTDTVLKLRSRLSNWKMKTLSIGGRLTLLKSVLGASPLYNMSIYKIPRGVLKSMEAIRSKIFNGADYSDKKIMWTAWDKVLASKKNGGLGVSSFHTLNRALLLKWVWRFISQDGSLWFHVIQALYGPSIDSYPVSLASNWCSIVRELNLLKDKGFDFLSHCKKRIWDGYCTRFWYDNWICDKSLRDRFPRLFALEVEKEVLVTVKMGASVVDSFRRAVRDGTERHQMLRLNSMLESVSLSSAQDRWICDLSGDGEFRVKEINVFAWRARRDCLPTRSNLIRRGVPLVSANFPLCQTSEEDIQHVLFQCDWAQIVLRKIFRWWDLDWQDLSSFSD
nr:RNA-directed DNA polymerase, eukaryota [Tanacetum cinerariifolium]